MLLFENLRILCAGGCGMQAWVLIGCGGALYAALELLYRGRTHWSMAVTGGLCFWLIGLFNELWPAAPLAIQMALGGAMITAAELVAGVLVNGCLRLHVWDYSGQAHNLFGQVCAPFGACWWVLSGAAVVLDDLLRMALFGESFTLPVLF